MRHGRTAALAIYTKKADGSSDWVHTTPLGKGEGTSYPLPPDSSGRRTDHSPAPYKDSEGDTRYDQTVTYPQTPQVSDPNAVLFVVEKADPDSQSQAKFEAPVEEKVFTPPGDLPDDDDFGILRTNTVESPSPPTQSPPTQPETMVQQPEAGQTAEEEEFLQ